MSLCSNLLRQSSISLSILLLMLFALMTGTLSLTIPATAQEGAESLKVKALRNGKPLRAYCEIMKASDDEEKGKEKVGEGWIEEEGTAFELTPGTYEVLVRDEEDSGAPTVSFDGVTIEAGKVVEKTAEFSGGTLRIKALRNGKPFRAYGEVLKQGDDEESGQEKVAEGWVENEGASFKLIPGTYDVQVFDEEDGGRPKVDFAAVTVEAGKAVEKTAEFSGGSLKVKASKAGKPVRAYCEVLKKGEEEEKISEGWAEDEGAVFKLTPGTYKVVVQMSDTEDKKELTDIAVEPAKVQAVEAQF